VVANDIITPNGLKYTNILPADAADLLSTCLFGNGNTLKQFNLNGLYSIVSNLASSQRSLDRTFAISVNPDYGSVAVQAQYIIDAADNPKNEMDYSLEALQELRKWTDSSINGTYVTICTIKDEWEYKSTDCQYPLGDCGDTTFAQPTACFIIGECDSSQANQRYTASNCPSSMKSTAESMIYNSQQYRSQTKYEYVQKADSILSYYNT
jgi:hypothetical protein